MLHNRRNKLAPLFRPIESKAKTNRTIAIRTRFLALASATRTSFDWFIEIFMPFVIGQSYYFALFSYDLFVDVV